MRPDHAVCAWLYPGFLGLVVGGFVARRRFTRPGIADRSLRYGVSPRI